MNDRLTTGLVLAVHRGSLHDGPGIRTTVFLKGCPLRCLWCHNPESQRGEPELAFRSERCVNCGACVPVCPNGAHRMESGTHRFARELCRACGECVRVCDAGALELYGKRMTVAECMEPVLADRSYYRRGGGGLTVSGGEPLAQPEFTAALLSAAREAGIHTCIETSGYGSDAALEQILPFTDLVLFDCKASDEETHRRLTGFGLERVHALRERVLASGVPAILRCPLIPGINDSGKHLAAIRAWAVHSGWPVEIMPYHPLGLGKAAAIGRPQTGVPEVAAPDETVAGWRVRLESAGAKLLL